MMYKEIEELRKRADSVEGMREEVKQLESRVEYLESAVALFSKMVSKGKFEVDFRTGDFKGCYGTTEKEDSDDNKI